METSVIISILVVATGIFVAWIRYQKYQLEKKKEHKEQRIGILVKLQIREKYEDFALGEKPHLGKKLQFSFVNTELQSIYIHRIKVDFYKNLNFLNETWVRELKSTSRFIEVKKGAELLETFILLFTNDQHYIDLFLSSSIKVHVTTSTGQVIDSKIFMPEIIP